MKESKTKFDEYPDWAVKIFSGQTDTTMLSEDLSRMFNSYTSCSGDDQSIKQRVKDSFEIINSIVKEFWEITDPCCTWLDELEKLISD